MNPNDFVNDTKAPYQIIARLGRDGRSGVAAYVACNAREILNTSYIAGYMDCAMAHHDVLSMFDSWNHATISYDPSTPVIVVW